MQKQLNAEINVLNRIMYMLEEKSVLHAAEQDASFAQFITDLYEEVGDRADKLRHA